MTGVSPAAGPAPTPGANGGPAHGAVASGSPFSGAAARGSPFSGAAARGSPFSGAAANGAPPGGGAAPNHGAAPKVPRPTPARPAEVATGHRAASGDQAAPAESVLLDGVERAVA